MAIEQANVIDLVSRHEGEIWLTISDHLTWDEDYVPHLLMLQGKLNAYFDFVESGQLLKHYPESKGLVPVISIAGSHPLRSEAEEFVQRAQSVAEALGARLQFRLVSQ